MLSHIAISEAGMTSSARAFNRGKLNGCLGTRLAIASGSSQLPIALTNTGMTKKKIMSRACIVTSEPNRTNRPPPSPPSCTRMTTDNP